MWDFDASEFMQVLFVFAVASLTETEVVACITVKTELPSFYWFLAAIAGEPSFELASGIFRLDLLFN